MTEPDDRAEAPELPRGTPLGEPGAAIPRWLALLVLIALLASGVWSAWLVLTGGRDAGSPPASAAATD